MQTHTQPVTGCHTIFAVQVRTSSSSMDSLSSLSLPLLPPDRGPFTGDALALVCAELRARLVPCALMVRPCLTSAELCLSPAGHASIAM